MKVYKHAVIQMLLEGTRRITESNEVEIELTGKQVKELDQIFKQFGADLNYVLSDEKVDEAGRKVPEYTKMSSQEIEDAGVVVKIDKKVLDSIEEIIELGKQTKTWYETINEKVLDAFSESDGVLFLILFAIFSPRNDLTTNLEMAALAYAGIKRDEESPENLELLLKFADLPTKDAVKIIETQYYKKNAAKAAKLNKDAKAEPTATDFLQLNFVQKISQKYGVYGTYFPNLFRMLKLWKAKNFTFTKKDAIAELSKHFNPSGALSDDTVLSAQKVFSFALNLLDPNYTMEGGWVPVTIDTWMMAFFYPDLSKEQREKILGGKYKQYTYLAKVTQELAGRYGMTPVEMQAAIWVGKIRKEKGDNYITTFESAINTNLKKFDKKIQSFEKMDRVMEAIIHYIGQY